MQERVLSLRNGPGSGYVIPLGPVSLVFVTAAHGMVGCGAIDIQALEKFGYPAARVRPITGPVLETLDDLLSGSVRETNASAERYGIRIGMGGKEALDLFS